VRGGHLADVVGAQLSRLALSDPAREQLIRLGADQLLLSPSHDGHVVGGAVIARPSSWFECRLIQEGERIGLTATQCVGPD